MKNNLLYKIVDFPRFAYNRLICRLIKKSFGKCGKNVILEDYGIFSNPSNIFVGNNVSIGPRSVFYATNATIYIGNYTMISPGVTIMTGEHRTDIIGEYMRNIKEEDKTPENDKPVIIEDDVWIGSNVTILKGVRIGRGSIIHAGQVITNNVKPYTIYVSNKIKVPRFSNDQIDEHEKKIREKYGVNYPEYHHKNNLFIG